MLIEHNASTTLTANNGMSALDFAVYSKNEKILKIVLDNIPPEEPFSDSKDGVFAILPCGHAKTCQLCCIKIINDSEKCPVCRANVERY